MKVLFISSKHSPEAKSSSLIKDLADEFCQQGHETVVLTPTDGGQPSDKIENGYRVVRSTSLKFFAVKGLTKALGVFTLGYFLRRTIKKKFKKDDFDIVVMHTPFIASHSLNRFLKSYLNCKTHLIVWDLFPQNAIDLGMLKKNLITDYLSKKLDKLLDQVDFISCMSEGNKNYIIQEHDVNKIDKIAVVYNWGTNKPKDKSAKKFKRIEFSLSEKDFVLLFGGNQGIPQRLEYIVHLAEDLKQHEDIKIFFIGKGTESQWLKNEVLLRNLTNVKILPQMSRSDYLSFASMCSIGLVSLDERFSVPNFPSKTTDYLSCGLPIVAHIDCVAKKDYGDFVVNQTKSGVCTDAGDRVGLYQKIIFLRSVPLQLENMSRNGIEFYSNELSTKTAYLKLSQLWQKHS